MTTWNVCATMGDAGASRSPPPAARLDVGHGGGRALSFCPSPSRPPSRGRGEAQGHGAALRPPLPPRAGTKEGSTDLSALPVICTLPRLVLNKTAVYFVEFIVEVQRGPSSRPRPGLRRPGSAGGCCNKIKNAVVCVLFVSSEQTRPVQAGRCGHLPLRRLWACSVYDNDTIPADLCQSAGLPPVSSVCIRLTRSAVFSCRRLVPSKQTGTHRSSTRS